jgi:rhodanese-related sulfurtransferase
MKVDKEHVIEKLKDQKVVVLNVLSKADFKKLHIKGSENMPFTADPKAFSAEVLEKYGKGKSFITYCDHMGLLASFEATKALTDSGLDALNYAGGVQEWYRAGLPVEGTLVEQNVKETPVELAAKGTE